MDIFEKDLEDMIWGCMVEDKWRELSSIGFPMPVDGVWFRQYDFGVGYGVADLICVNFKISRFREGGVLKRWIQPEIAIYELKRNKITINALEQSLRYFGAIMSILENMERKYKNTIFQLPTPHIVLIGKDVNKSDGVLYAPQAQIFTSLYTYKFDALKGLTFQNYFLIDRPLKESKFNLNKGHIKKLLILQPKPIPSSNTDTQNK